MGALPTEERSVESVSSVKSVSPWSFARCCDKLPATPGKRLSRNSAMIRKSKQSLNCSGFPLRPPRPLRFKNHQPLTRKRSSPAESLAGLFRCNGRPSTAALPVPPQGPPTSYTSFNTDRVKPRRTALARSRAEAAAKIRADTRSEVVASTRRSPLAPNARSWASRSANAFVDRSFPRLNI